eukprot:76258_1
MTRDIRNKMQRIFEKKIIEKNRLYEHLEMDLLFSLSVKHEKDKTYLDRLYQYLKYYNNARLHINTNEILQLENYIVANIYDSDSVQMDILSTFDELNVSSSIKSETLTKIRCHYMVYVVQENVDNSCIRFLADVYERDRLMYCHQVNKKENDTLTISKWALLNKYMLNIKAFSNDEHEFNMIISALNSYYKYICPLMDVKPMFKINDNY